MQSTQVCQSARWAEGVDPEGRGGGWNGTVKTTTTTMLHFTHPNNPRYSTCQWEGLLTQDLRVPTKWSGHVTAISSILLCQAGGAHGLLPGGGEQLTVSIMQEICSELLADGEQPFAGLIGPTCDIWRHQTRPAPPITSSPMSFAPAEIFDIAIDGPLNFSVCLFSICFVFSTGLVQR